MRTSMETTEYQLRWGICSAGAIAHDFVSSLLGHEDQHRVTAVAARSLERAKKFADDLKIPTAYGSYEDLANDPDVDIVYVASINTAHRSHCNLFMTHKKHVLCEKPCTLSLQETQEILKTAKENDVFFMEGYWTAFFPACHKIRDILTSGQLGDVISVMGNHGQAIAHKERIAKKDLGGGALYDLGGYLVQMVVMVCGKAPFSSHTYGFLNDDSVDEMYTTTMLFLGNVMATLSCTSRAGYPNDFTIVGTKGRIRIPETFWTPTTVEWTNEHGDTKYFEFALPLSGATYHHGDAWSAMYYEAEAVRLAIAKGMKEHPLLSWKDTQLISRLMDKARQDMQVTWDHEPSNGD